jgi:Trp repressor protein
MLNRKQKEQLIVKLLEANKTYKEIAKETHASFSEISKVNKKLNGDDTEPSIQNLAYKKYLEGKRPIDVAIELKIDSIEATRYWSEYLQLAREYKLLDIRTKLKGNFPPFVSLFELMQKKKCSIEEIKRALEVAENIDKEGIYLEFLKARVSKVNEEWDRLGKLLKGLKNEIEYMESIKQVLLFEIATFVKFKPYIERLFSSPQINPRPTNRSLQL